MPHAFAFMYLYQRIIYLLAAIVLFPYWAHLKKKNYHVYIYITFFSSSTDSFVNSQEWTLSRSVPELKVVSLCPSTKF